MAHFEPQANHENSRTVPSENKGVMGIF